MVGWIETLKGEGYAVTLAASGFYHFVWRGEIGERVATEGDAWQDARRHRNWSQCEVFGGHSTPI